MIDLLYLLASCFFIFGLKLLSSPRTATSGNALAALGMLIAAAATIWIQGGHGTGPLVILAGIAVGGVAGIIAAQKVRMTAMPQMVALFNGLGGAASVLVAASDLVYQRARSLPGGALYTPGGPVELGAGAAASLIGAVTFTGSVVAFLKLQELVSGRPVVYPFQKSLNAAILAIAVACIAWMFLGSAPLVPFLILSAAAAVLGVLSVLPIGGADMPVVISLLNSYSGLAAAAAGFILRNNALIIGGALVGASGIILTRIMCRAMNRSLANVLFGAFGQLPAAALEDLRAETGHVVRRGSPEDAAMLLESAHLVIVVPGYGMAVAQAQHAVRELADILVAKGAEVKYAIHPVAGRMPGHMNVLLAEADVPYDQLYDMDAINPLFAQADVALVIGANDVTNPAARTDRSSPIYGMPILDVDRSRTVMVLKRSMNPGFAGVENELYFKENTMMVFGDAKETVTHIIGALKDL